MSQTDWTTANQEFVVAELNRVAGLIVGAPVAEPTEWTDAGRPPAIDQLVDVFDLSDFERDVLLLCAGVELDSAFAERCLGGSSVAPTFGLALGSLTDPHWSAVTPAGALRRWKLIDVGCGAPLTSAPLRIDERILHHIAGVAHTDERLAGLVFDPPATGGLVPSFENAAGRLLVYWQHEVSGDRQPVVQLCGSDLADLVDVVGTACSAAGLGLAVAPAAGLPRASGEIEDFARVWERESAISNVVLVIDATSSRDDVREVDLAVERLIRSLNAFTVVATRDRRDVAALRAGFTLHLDPPTEFEQRELWLDRLDRDDDGSRELAAALAAQFDLGPTVIDAACTVAAVEAGASEVRDQRRTTAQTRVWDACRSQAREGMVSLARRIDGAATWDDLVVSDATRGVLRSVVRHVRHRPEVYGDWGFAKQNTRGRGVSALFAGPSGTGKTLAAEVLAAELQLDLYAIDLSSMVSKYIGETEKNLRRVFDTAESSGAILLFDEADALFGKRSEVKDSHDRFANIEVSYLLQRMERYRGVAILTTNMKEAVDTAFLRRISFIIDFPFPDEAMRSRLWRRAFPSTTPIKDLDIERLAQLHVSGGSIRNIALAAAFLAAEEGEPVGMGQIQRAAAVDYAKSERHLTPGELEGWT